ncbi:hypothetical protein Tco_1353582 [Tanacetum coccineum]
MALESAAWCNLLDKMPQMFSDIESKSKSSLLQKVVLMIQTASLEDKMTIKMNQMMNEMKALVVTTPAPVKAVEEVCVTCGLNHNFNLCPLTQGGNNFPVFHDDIQQFQQTAAVGNFLQRNQPSNLASQMRPPCFNQPNVQNNQGNQNRYQGNNFNSNQNHGTNFNQNRPNNQGAVYQPPTNQVLPYQPPTNGVLKTDFESYVKANDAILKNVQNQNQGNTNQASSSSSLPSNTIPNPRNEAKAITTCSGASYDLTSDPRRWWIRKVRLTKDTGVPKQERTSNIMVQEQNNGIRTNQRAFLAQRTKPNLPYLQDLQKRIREKDDILL